MKKLCNLTVTHQRYDQRVFQKESITEKRNYETHLVVSDGKPDELKDGIHIHGVKRHGMRTTRVVFSVFQVYQKAKMLGADVYVLHDLDLLWIVPFLKKHTNTVIWDLHEDYPMVLKSLLNTNVFKKFACFWIFSTLWKVMIKRLDACITVCDDRKKWLEHNGCKCCYVLHNYALKAQFEDNNSPNFFSARSVLFVGTFSPIKGVHLFIQATALCKHDIKFILIGRRVCKKYYNFCRRLQGWENVEYLQNRGIDDIREQAKLCFAGLGAHGPKKELSDVKNYEYMALALPIIHRKSELFESFIHNDGHPLGLCVGSAPQAIADAIDYLYEHKEVARAMGMNGRKAFETKYNFESEADGFLKFLEEVCQSKNPNK